MSSRRIIVTGGAGFIGSHTVVDLVEQGFEPVILDDFSNSKASVLTGIEAICGGPVAHFTVDCRDRAAVSRIFSEVGDISGVIHFAASKFVGESQSKPLLYYGNNLGSLVTLLEVMGEHEVSDLVLSSSCTVYGQPATLPVTEQAPIAPPVSVYGHTKQICEQIVRDSVASGMRLRATLLRFFNPVGAHPSARLGELPQGEPQNLVPIILQSAAGMRGPVQIHGADWATEDGTCVRDYIHVMDLAAAHVKSLDWMARQPEEGLVEVLNVGTGAGTSVREALAAFEKATGISVAWEIGPRRAGDIEQIYASCDKAAKTLGWRATRTIEEALSDAWAWQRSLTRR